ncbi:hypothetical protein P3W85_45280 [Cupriavidus basilensis]|uniref:Proline-rich region n=1 Tax=Cupriavidus basilensis TaxID=68895 RepID=A0ABT6B5V3_9BURK|nr:hypothetical protein [Cupriavidus basilensis]MDF3840088.1 hypothetical protein [Cupriavidus basilensis]
MNGLRVGQLLLVLAMLGASGTALAGRGGWHGGGGFHGGFHGRVGVGVVIGPGFYGYGYPYPYPYAYPYYYPGYYPPAVVGVPASPPQYIEQGEDDAVDMGGGAAAAPQQQAYWYHCTRPNGYYPYIKSCPAGWQKVPAQPPG